MKSSKTRLKRIDSIYSKYLPVTYFVQIRFMWSCISYPFKHCDKQIYFVIDKTFESAVVKRGYVTFWGEGGGGLFYCGSIFLTSLRWVGDFKAIQIY